MIHQDAKRSWTGQGMPMAASTSSGSPTIRLVYLAAFGFGHPKKQWLLIFGQFSMSFEDY